jgi:hypothetical protein
MPHEWFVKRYLADAADTPRRPVTEPRAAAYFGGGYRKAILDVGGMIAGQGQPAVRADCLDSLDDCSTRVARIVGDNELANDGCRTPISVRIDQQPVSVAQSRIHAVPGHGDPGAPRSE